RNLTSLRINFLILPRVTDTTSPDWCPLPYPHVLPCISSAFWYSSFLFSPVSSAITSAAFFGGNPTSNKRNDLSLSTSFAGAGLELPAIITTHSFLQRQSRIPKHSLKDTHQARAPRDQN